MKIDVHNHVLPHSAVEVMREDPGYGMTIEGDQLTGGNHPLFPWSPSFHDPDAKVAELQSKGLDGAVLSTAPPLFFYNLDAERGERISRATNEGLKEFAAAHPDRFRWMATLPMAYPGRLPAFLEEAVADGAVGVEVGTNIDGHRLDEAEFEPFWAAAERLDIPVLIHPAFNEDSQGMADFYFQNVIGNQLETTIAVERLIAAGVLDRHPAVRVVLVHAGGYFPFQAGRLRHARTVRVELQESPTDPWKYFGQVVVDTITHDTATLTNLISRVGRDNVVMGTDLPFDMATPEPMRMLEAAVDAESVRVIAETNPAKLYRFDN